MRLSFPLHTLPPVGRCKLVTLGCRCSDLLANGCCFQFSQLGDYLFQCFVDGLKCFLIALIGTNGTFTHGSQTVFQGLQLRRASKRQRRSVW